jgi:flagella basal body P-ring formation protein FlgA
MSARAWSVERGAWSALGALVIGSFVAASPLSAQTRASCGPVAARALARGHVLTDEDIATAGASGGSTLCASRSTLLGSITRRVIAPGEPLRAPSIAPPNVIESGQPVAVVWREPGIEVRLKGVAANAAAVGDRVTVRVDGRRRLEGVAVAPGLVQLQ